ncbi:hypothetical protein FKM82_005342 [Ascaphus truei]
MVPKNDLFVVVLLKEYLPAMATLMGFCIGFFLFLGDCKHQKEPDKTSNATKYRLILGDNLAEKELIGGKNAITFKGAIHAIFIFLIPV